MRGVFFHFFFRHISPLGNRELFPSHLPRVFVSPAAFVAVSEISKIPPSASSRYRKPIKHIIILYSSVPTTIILIIYYIMMTSAPDGGVGIYIDEHFFIFGSRYYFLLLLLLLLRHFQMTIRSIFATIIQPHSSPRRHTDNDGGEDAFL